ncbi:unnamed protein product [Timema podura]|uniref:Uncharacterized protein n=1 Tax=Timema podura TaxID=61482 RepID=A0ABN7NIE7_TIMPD|nr:unnamed protein product [Timema podura]
MVFARNQAMPNKHPPSVKIVPTSAAHKECHVSWLLHKGASSVFTKLDFLFSNSLCNVCVQAKLDATCLGRPETIACLVTVRSLLCTFTHCILGFALTTFLNNYYARVLSCTLCCHPSVTNLLQYHLEKKN